MSEHKHSHTCTISTGSSVFQTLDELEFERGIWYAAQNGDLQRVKKLLNQGTSVDKRDNAGYTALHYAARAGYVDVCKFLLSNGADINAATRSGQATALHRAAYAGQYRVISFKFGLIKLVRRVTTFRQ